MSPRRPRAAFHPVILAGGSGTRFWPASRKARPKQFLALDGKAPLLESTWKRARRLAPAERIWVVAPAHLVDGVTEMLPDLAPANLVVEPSPRDTAPAIVLACAAVADRNPEGIVGIFPSDHVIRDAAAFADSVRTGIESARGGSLVCLGIRPDRPATGFGYLRCGDTPRPDCAVPVARFVEKPDLARARRYVKSGQYLWNAGMFLWRADRFLREAEGVAPAVHRAVMRFRAGDRAAWSRGPRISVDYAVMERAEDVRVVALDAGWDDVGSWAAAADLRSEGAGRDPRCVLVDSEETVVFGEDRLVAVVGVPGVAVVDTPDALLVVARDRAEDVRKVVEEVKRRKRRDLL